jgi:hypothetical protein
LEPWLVAWEEFSSYVLNDDWDVYANQVKYTGQIGSQQAVGHTAAGYGDKVAPFIDGDEGQFFVAYTVVGSSILTRSIGCQRLDWPGGASAPTRGQLRTLAGASTLSPPTLQGFAYDSDTGSHWVAVYERGTSIYCKRIGHTGGVTESATVHAYSSGVGAGSVAYLAQSGADEGRFLLAWSDNNFLFPLYGRFLGYPDAKSITTGTSCGGALFTPVGCGRPYAGNGNLYAVMHGVIPGTTGFFLAGPLPGNQPIPGAPGCMIFLDPVSMFVAFSAIADNKGVARMPLPLPDDPVFTGDLYFQGVCLDPQANPLGLETTNRLLLEIR